MKSIFKFWMVKCPKCGASIEYWKTHKTINCTECNISIKSNWGIATVKCLVAILISLPITIPLAAWLAPVIFGKNADYLDWRLLLAFFEFAIATIVYPRVLRLSL